MKKDIHPEAQKKSLRCACGFEIQALSTQRGDIQLEICSNCHPFYTGKQKFVDTAGRIDRFQKKYAGFRTDSKQADA